MSTDTALKSLISQTSGPVPRDWPPRAPPSPAPGEATGETKAKLRDHEITVDTKSGGAGRHRHGSQSGGTGAGGAWHLPGDLSRLCHRARHSAGRGAGWNGRRDRPARLLRSRRARAAGNDRRSAARSTLTTPSTAEQIDTLRRVVNGPLPGPGHPRPAGAHRAGGRARQARPRQPRGRTDPSPIMFRFAVSATGATRRAAAVGVTALSGSLR